MILIIISETVWNIIICQKVGQIWVLVFFLLLEHIGNGSQLAETLYQFLICERSSQLAAQRLDVHRNTMNNRLKKIEQLTDLNLNLIEEREYLQLSYQFYKNCRK